MSPGGDSEDILAAWGFRMRGSGGAGRTSSPSSGGSAQQSSQIARSRDCCTARGVGEHILEMQSNPWNVTITNDMISSYLCIVFLVITNRAKVIVNVSFKVEIRSLKK